MQVSLGWEGCCIKKMIKEIRELMHPASWSLIQTERIYPACKLEFFALKWAVMDRFHEYLYGGKFDVYTDNNPLAYILTSAKLDACGQR